MAGLRDLKQPRCRFTTHQVNAEACRTPLSTVPRREALPHFRSASWHSSGSRAARAHDSYLKDLGD